MVGEPVDGVVGYDPKAATQLMQHLVLWAESGGKDVAPSTDGPTTLPAPNLTGGNKPEKTASAGEK